MESEESIQPWQRPEFMTDVHMELLKVFWSEGMTPTPMATELADCAKLTMEQSWEIVQYWLWSDRFSV